MIKKNFFKKILFLFLLFFPIFCFGDSYLDEKEFFVDKNYDYYQRKKISAINLVLGEKTYFYVEKDFWKESSDEEKQKFFQRLKELSKEFEQKIYPALTQLLGKEPEKGINQDSKITVLVHQMREDIAGYFREEDNYEKNLAPFSNERKMIYLNAFKIEREEIKEEIAHEFVHLIEWEQKLKKSKEKTWVLEMIAETAPTILGYKETLKKRIEVFKKFPQTSLIEWKNELQNYGIVSVFGQYLVSQYGEKILQKILKEKETGTLGIEKAVGESFSEIFKNFLLALYFQDCKISPKFCFKNELLNSFKILPKIHILPSSNEFYFSFSKKIKPFSGNWEKIYGENKNFKVRLKGEKIGAFKVSVLFCDFKNLCEIKEFDLKENNEIEFVPKEIKKDFFSLLVIPISTFESNNEENVGEFEFTLEALSTKEEVQTKENFCQNITCKKFQRFLKKGMRGEDVKCLQEILKSEGPEIYPEGLVTGYFGPLTFRAVVKFQEKYSKEILQPFGLKKGTGFVGFLTLKKLNSILKKCQK
jgi:hypothetical protein